MCVHVFVCVYMCVCMCVCSLNISHVTHSGGMEEEGIYRKPGVIAKCNKLVKDFVDRKLKVSGMDPNPNPNPNPNPKGIRDGPAG